MINLKILNNLRKNFPWKDFIDTMVNQGFQVSNSLTTSNRAFLSSGRVMLVDNPIGSGTVRDPSLLSLQPYILFRPINEDQLGKIIIHSKNYKIPITFASGKTGLSGGFANFGVLVDLENLNADSKPIILNNSQNQVYAEQSALVSDLIKVVHFYSNGKKIFPVQPASALKLPVRVGGLIASNASGITSGKLGPANDWIINLRVMLPNGSIIEIDRNNSLYSKIVGGNGFYGVVLSANFKLYEPELNLERTILFGDDLPSAFNGLQKVLNAKIFPLVSEFVTSPIKLPGNFGKLTPLETQSDKLNVNWAVLLKGKNDIVSRFIRIMVQECDCYWFNLDEEEYQNFMQERSSFAIIVQTSEDDINHIAFPGFEDILSHPKYLPNIIDTINNIFTKNGFHKVIFGYGHINFRKGKGLLLHMRLPVPIEYFYREHSEMLIKVCETVYEVIRTLKNQFKIQYKAEHSSGPFAIWLDAYFRNNLEKDISAGFAFYNPHLMIYNQLKQEIDKKSSKNIEKELFVLSMMTYLY